MTLNRRKTKIMGLGGWEGEVNWPLPYLQPVNNVKIFGLEIYPNLKDTIDYTWANIIKNINLTVNMWATRRFMSLKSKVFIINCFILSKAWYIAQILPPPQNVIDKIEKNVRKFLWKGFLEKIAYPETLLPKDKGGLSLPSVKHKAQALATAQFCRFLKAKNTPTNAHLRYWLQISIPRFFEPSIGPRSQISNQFFNDHKNLILKATQQGLISPTEPCRTKCKGIYQAFVKNDQTDLLPKVEVKNPDRNWKLTWNRLFDKEIPLEFFDVFFKITHNIYPNNNRLLHMRLSPSENCSDCVNQIDTNVHRFTQCIKTKSTWSIVRFIVNRMSDDKWSSVSDETLLSLTFPKSRFQKDVIFLLFCFVNYVEEHRLSNAKMNANSFAGFLKFNVTTTRTGSYLKLKEILSLI